MIDAIGDLQPFDLVAVASLLQLKVDMPADHHLCEAGIVIPEVGAIQG